MKRLSILTLAIVALAGFMAITVWAANAHFLKCSASGVNSDGSLNACFKIAGLGDNQLVTVTATAHADATYACRTNGQQCPNAANKVNVQTDVSATGTFMSGRNGTISKCLTIDPPEPEITCPRGQTLVLVSVTYTNVSVSAFNGTATCDVSGTFSDNFFPNCP